MLKIIYLFQLVSSKVFKIKVNKFVESKDSRKMNETINNFFKFKKSKNKKSKIIIYIKMEDTKKLIFPTSNAKKIFNPLQQMFIKALII